MKYPILKRLALVLMSVSMALSLEISPALQSHRMQIQAKEDDSGLTYAYPEPVYNIDASLLGEEDRKFEFSSREKDVQPYEGTFEERVNQLRRDLPQGRCWNHFSPDSAYSLTSTTDVPCSDHGSRSGSVKCNSFDQGVQCAGFAYLCYYKCHGYLRSSRIGTRYVVGNEGIRAGDVIRMSGHTAFVWNVNGDQLSILEANYGASCRIDHSRTVRASEVLHYWTPKAYVLHYNANGGQGSPNAKIVPIDTPYTLGDGALWRPGYQFAGWTVSRLTSSESLYEKNGTRAYFADPVQAQQEGWKLAVVASWESLTPSDFGQPLAQSGDDIELRAVWKEKTRTLSFDPGIGQGTMEPILVSLGEGGTQIPACTFIHDAMAFNGWLVYRPNGQILCSSDGTLRGDLRYFDTIPNARGAGYSPVQIPDGAVIHTLGDDSEEPLRLEAQWTGYSRARAERVNLQRLYNPNSGEHFYTESAVERDALVQMGWTYEGEGWTAPVQSELPVYRLYNPNAGDHHYTLSEAEKDGLVRAGWIYEKIGWYSDPAKGVPIYRQYNPNAKAGAHNFTKSSQENQALGRLGWVAEGISWYGTK